MSAFTRLDWLIAWRHLRTGDDRPVWVRPLILLSIYLIVVGLALAWYAGSLGGDSEGGMVVVSEVCGPLEQEIGPTPMERNYGTFGGITLAIGVMALVFGVLAWAFALLPTIITMSVLLGCMALVVVLSLMSGLEGDLRDKILNQKAHVRVSTIDGRPFSDYDALAEALGEGDGIAGASPYLEGEIMVRSGLNRQGAMLSGIIADRHTAVSNLESLVCMGDYAYLQHPEDIPAVDPFALDEDGTPWRLRHLESERKKPAAPADEAEPDAHARGDAPAGTRKPPPLPSEDGEPKFGLGPVGMLAQMGEPRDSADDDDDFAGDDGWEDPAAVLPQIRRPGKLPPGPDDDATPGVSLRGLPAPPPLDPVWDDGWEDPSSEIERLREKGELPPEADQPPPQGEPRGSEKPDALDASPDERVLDPILIGRELSMELGVRVASEVQLITPIGRTTPAGQIPGMLGVKVAGVFFSGMYEYDRKNVYAPLETVQRFLLTGDRVSGIEVKLDDVQAIDAGKAEVERIVGSSGRDDLMVEDWRDLNRNLFSAMFLEKVAMFIALLFVVLVASFGILASNLMSVMEKSKEIAILKAMGISDRGILRIFIAEGLTVGLVGSFGGIAMGLALCWALDRYGLPLNENVYYIEKLPVMVNPVEVALVGVAALVIVCVSSLYPALVASSLRPVDGLRHGDK